jgi:hypothetical protein
MLNAILTTKGSFIVFVSTNSSQQNFGRFYYIGKIVERIKDDTV